MGLMAWTCVSDRGTWWLAAVW